MAATSNAQDIFAALQERSPQMEIDGEQYWIVEGDLVLDDRQLWSYAVRQAEREKPGVGGGAEVQPLMLVTDSLGRIVRWRKGKVLTYSVRRNSFVNDAQYSLAVDTLRAACADWEAVCGVNFRHLVELDQVGATGMVGTEQPVFDVVGVAARSRLIASAFFPDWLPARRHVYIYPTFFDADLYYDRTGVLRHELGHVLGFRHEHIRPGVSPLCPKEALDNTFPFGDYDPHSVMHYFCGGVGTREMKLTKIDRDGARFVYGPPDSEVTYFD